MERIDKYKKFFTKDYLMGPNSLRIADELIKKYPLQLNYENVILELGCGTGLSSLFIAKETSAVVHATDLWIGENENAERFKKWGMTGRIIPLCLDASVTEFEQGKYDAVISIDAYHYFAGKEKFFVERILPAMKDGGIALIAVPGVKEECEGTQEETIREWVGEEAYMFHSCNWWKNIIGIHPSIEFVDTWEMECFGETWKDWIKSGHEKAEGDKKFYDSVIKKYSCIVGIAVKKRD